MMLRSSQSTEKDAPYHEQAMSPTGLCNSYWQSLIQPAAVTPERETWSGLTEQNPSPKQKARYWPRTSTRPLPSSPVIAPQTGAALWLYCTASACQRFFLNTLDDQYLGRAEKGCLCEPSWGQHPRRCLCSDASSHNTLGGKCRLRRLDDAHASIQSSVPTWRRQARLGLPN